MPLPDHGRYEYHPLPERPRYLWPGGAGLAVYLGVNLEHFAFGEGLGAELVPQGGAQPDVLNYAWRDYGNRVGAWRLLELLDSLELPATVLLNSAMYDYAPQLVAAHRTRGDEIAGHGRTNSERQGGAMTVGEERRLIAESTAAIEHHEGRPPAGWLSPWIAESAATPDLLAEAGYLYTLNWCADDQPIWLRTTHGPLLAVPYPQEVNDIPAIAVRKDASAQFADMIIDDFDERLEQAKGMPLVMGIALHPYLVGQPYRLRQLRRALSHLVARRSEVWFTTAGAIAEHCRALPPGIVPGG